MSVLRKTAATVFFLSIMVGPGYPVGDVLVITDPVWSEEPSDHNTFDKTDLTEAVIFHTSDELCIDLAFNTDWAGMQLHILLETAFDADGAASDPFVQPVNYGHEFKPDYALTLKYTMNDYGDFRRWNVEGGQWEFYDVASGLYGPPGNNNIAGLWTTKGPSQVNFRIPWNPLGGRPDSLMVEVYLTQDTYGVKRSAFDSIPSDSTLDLDFDYLNPGPGDWDVALGPVTLTEWSPVYQTGGVFPNVPVVNGVDIDPPIVEGGQTVNVIAEVHDTGSGIGLVCADLTPLGGLEQAVMRDDGDPRSGDRIAGDGRYGILWRVPENWMPGTVDLEIRSYCSLMVQYDSGRVQATVLPDDIIVHGIDALGDDHGPNQPGQPGLYYTYPTAADVFIPGIFDLCGLRIDRVLTNAGGSIEERLAFCVDVACFPERGQPGNPDWNPFFGDMSVAKVDILIDAAPGGTVTSLPWRGAMYQYWDAWEYAIVMDGWYKAVIPSGGSESLEVWRANALQDDASIVLLSDHCGGTISALVDPAALGDPTDEDIRSWDIIVQMSSHDFGGEEVLGGIRFVYSINSPWNFGGGDMLDRDANLLDILLIPGEGNSAGRPQEFLLDYTTEEAADRFLNGKTPVSLEASALGPSAVPEVQPQSIGLDQNAPNPFNPRTTIAFRVTGRTRVSLRVYDVTGRAVRTLMESTWMVGGRHEVIWDGTDDRGRNVSSGAYFCVLETAGFRKSVRMALIR